MSKKKCTTGSIVDQAKALVDDKQRLTKEVEKLREWQKKYTQVRNGLTARMDAAERRAKKAEQLAATWRLYAKRLETHVKGPVISVERGFVKAHAEAAPEANHGAWMQAMK